MGRRVQVTSEQRWQQWKDMNAHDPYSAAIIAFTERWANMMEAEMVHGQEFEQIAAYTSRQANVEDIDMNQYNAAVTMLADVWVHGEQLRKWYNHSVQIAIVIEVDLDEIVEEGVRINGNPHAN